MIKEYLMKIFKKDQYVNMNIKQTNDHRVKVEIRGLDEKEADEIYYDINRLVNEYMERRIGEKGVVTKDI